MQHPEDRWTVDTLRQFLLEALAANERRCTDRAVTADAARTLVVDALHTAEVNTERRFTQLEGRINDRLDAMEQARQLLLETMRADQEHANELVAVRIDQLSGAVNSLDRLTDSKFVTYRSLLEGQAEKVGLALNAADKAVNKAEVATEKRFEGVNEFRAQLADQASTLMPRTEAEQRIAQNTEKIGDIADRLAALSSRIDLQEGRSGGHTDSAKNIVTLIGIVLTAVTVIVGVYLAFHK